MTKIFIRDDNRNIIGVENLSLNDKQIEKLETHLKKQDEQYEEIKRLLKEGGIYDK